MHTRELSKSCGNTPSLGEEEGKEVDTRSKMWVPLTLRLLHFPELVSVGYSYPEDHGERVGQTNVKGSTSLCREPQEN